MFNLFLTMLILLCRRQAGRMLWSQVCVHEAMLKHVSSSNLSPYKVQRCLARDTVSLSSSLSFGSSGAQEPLSSRSSSTSSLHDVLAQRPPKVSFLHFVFRVEQIGNIRLLKSSWIFTQNASNTFTIPIV